MSHKESRCCRAVAAVVVVATMMMFLDPFSGFSDNAGASTCHETKWHLDVGAPKMLSNVSGCSDGIIAVQGDIGVDALDVERLEVILTFCINNTWTPSCNVSTMVFHTIASVQFNITIVVPRAPFSNKEGMLKMRADAKPSHPTILNPGGTIERLVPLSANPCPGISLELEKPYEEVLAGKRAKFNYTVRNTGNMPDTIGVFQTAHLGDWLKGGWNRSLASLMTIDRSDSTNGTLSFDTFMEWYDPGDETRVLNLTFASWKSREAGSPVFVNCLLVIHIKKSGASGFDPVLLLLSLVICTAILRRRGQTN